MQNLRSDPRPPKSWSASNKSARVFVCPLSFEQHSDKERRVLSELSGECTVYLSAITGE